MNNICLLIHCLHDKGFSSPEVHPELFIQLRDIEALIISLKAQGYRFKLPAESKDSDGPVCSITFDDGYFNNIFFLDIAEKYNIPFILFLTSYNVIYRVPFIWDIWDATRNKKWPVSSIDYRKLYDSLKQNEKGLLSNDCHRPFLMEELERFSSHPLVYLAPHGHTHQPMVGRFIKRIDEEIDNNLLFLSRYCNVLKQDFSFPCGLYTRYVKKRLLNRFERIYTINGGGYSSDENMIHRISLINPDFGGPLIAQIKKSFSTKFKVFRQAVNVRYSNRLFYLI